MPPPPEPATALLPDELLEEIFLRLPPDDPASLVRASVASKPWLSLLTSPRFLRRYRKFHGSPPILGFLYRKPWPSTGLEEEEDLTPFVSTTSFVPRVPDDQDWADVAMYYSAWDCRHGRVLLYDMATFPMGLVVWDPMNGNRSELPAPEEYSSQSATVLCAVSGCDHLVCHEGPFRAVFVGLHDEDDGTVAYAHVSLLEVGEWSKPCSLEVGQWSEPIIVDMPPVFLQDAFYFMVEEDDDDDEDDDDAAIAILKYDLGSNCLSLIDAPLHKTRKDDSAILMSMKDGGLGFAYLDVLTLNLWSTQIRSNRVPTWTRRVFVNLKELLPIRNIKQALSLTGSVESSDIIFVTTDLGIYEINLKSLLWKKLWKSEKGHALFPYMSFYHPQERSDPL